MDRKISRALLLFVFGFFFFILFICILFQLHPVYPEISRHIFSFLIKNFVLFVVCLLLLSDIGCVSHVIVSFEARKIYN